jgi:glycine cleavage system aminomethyltransferase T
MVDHQVTALRTSAALSWSDHVACVRVEGMDGYEVLDRLCSSELHMRDGQLLATLLLNEQAVPVADVFLARDDEDFILLAEGMTGPELCDHIRAEAPEDSDFEVRDLGTSHRLLSLNGPYSWEVLAGVAGSEVVGLPYLTFFQLEGTLCFRTGKTGEFGYDLLVPREDADGMAARFQDVGEEFDLAWAGLEALEVCALENWFFNIRREGRFGLTPLELQLQWRVSPRKGFLGSRALEERRQAGVKARVTCIESVDPISTGQRVRLPSLTWTMPGPAWTSSKWRPMGAGSRFSPSRLRLCTTGVCSSTLSSTAIS